MAIWEASLCYTFGSMFCCDFVGSFPCSNHYTFFQSLIQVFDLLHMMLYLPRKVSDFARVNCGPLLDTKSSGLHFVGNSGQESNYSSRCDL